MQRWVNTRSVRNITAGKVATMNACANSTHLQNSWKSYMQALFFHLGGLSGIYFCKTISNNFSFFEEFLNSQLNVLTAGPPKYWRLIWKKLWNLRSSTLGSKIWRSGIRGTDPDPTIHPWRGARAKMPLWISGWLLFQIPYLYLCSFLMWFLRGSLPTLCKLHWSQIHKQEMMIPVEGWWRWLLPKVWVGSAS